MSRVELRTNNAFEWHEAVDWVYTPEHEVEFDEFEEVADGGMRAIVRVRVEIAWTPTVEDGDDAGVSIGEPPFQLALEVAGLFAWAPQLRPDDRIARLWLEYNGRYLLWPYVRSYVAMLTTMTDKPAMTIDTMRVPDPPAVDDDEHAADADARISDRPERHRG